MTVPLSLVLIPPCLRAQQPAPAAVPVQPAAQAEAPGRSRMRACQAAGGSFTLLPLKWVSFLCRETIQLLRPRAFSSRDG